MDTLSLAREGARATGTDFSEPAIELVRSLASELDLDARFVCCDFYDLPQNLEGRFDIILMSYGVIGWLHDLQGWAQIVADFLEPGGRLHLVEWPAGIGDVFSALVDAGLAVESFREYPWCNEQLRPSFVQGSDGKWRSPPDTAALPIVYSVRATKPPSKPG